MNILTLLGIIGFLTIPLNLVFVSREDREARLSHTPGQKPFIAVSLIVLVMILVCMGAIYNDILPSFFGFYVIIPMALLYHCFRGFMEWKYLRPAKHYVVTFITAGLMVVGYMLFLWYAGTGMDRFMEPLW
ncbi:DUF4181 domain-containing protein [Paenibacillus lemnae]|uniref:DUF4181 domain-containing protein n=1 Tax=Paenibacillus lemnae TaxID=1330551 RepID=A0A848M969_PAELE|nr:DUF4181 domain-containing protein [Paenibacillus lemnae]NMO97156.1 DUF4181 domain-containing protein [Paenibacillus lemnae]